MIRAVKVCLNRRNATRSPLTGCCYPTQREAVAAGLKRAKQDGAIVFIYDASGKLCIYANFGDPAATNTLTHLEIRGGL